MKSSVSKLKENYPVIIVGGGVNGVGMARDFALRGVDCLLVEKNDFSAGTSGSSSGMIHGGPRYMLGDVSVTKLSCLDSGYIQKMAPHLLFRIPFLYTVYKQKEQSAFSSQMHLEAVEAFFKAYDKFVPLKNGEPHTRLSAKEVLELEPGLPTQDLMGGVTFDEWGIDVPRLCVANAVDAKNHGAHLATHTKVIQVLKDQNQVKGVVLKDLLTGDEKTVFCKYLINATGPWSPHFAKLMGVPIRLRGGKGIHITFDRRLFNMAVVSQCIDGREIFVMPYENVSILGTTDDDYFGDLDDQKCTAEEIEYLLEGIEQVFPAIRKARMIRAWSGVRPTLYARDCYEDALSREHEILDHDKTGELKGALSMVGGKLASYRIMAKEMADLVCEKLGHKTPSITHKTPLPGGDSLPSVSDLCETYQLDALTVSRLVYRHGSKAKDVLQILNENPESAALICACEPVTKAEVDYVIQNEMVRTLSDVRRRTRLTLGPCQGTSCLIPALANTKESLKIDSSVNQAGVDFMNEWWWNRAMVMNSDQLRQEELNQALHFCNNSLELE